MTRIFVGLLCIAIYCASVLPAMTPVIVLFFLPVPQFLIGLSFLLAFGLSLGLIFRITPWIFERLIRLVPA